MASIIKDYVPPCLQYSGQRFANGDNNTQKKYDGTTHLSLSYKIYRWYEGTTESLTEFSKMYSDWCLQSGKFGKYFYGSYGQTDLEAKTKVIANEYRKKADKNPKYCSDGCSHIVFTASGMGRLCYLCPYSPEYMNARLDTENIVLGYALANMDTSFIEKIFNFGKMAGPSYIYYENIAAHFTGMYPALKEGLVQEKPYNFNALVAYYIIHSAEEIRKGNLTPAQQEIKNKFSYGANAIMSTLMNELHLVSEELKKDGTGFKRDNRDYSYGLSYNDALNSFSNALSSIVMAGLSSSAEEYEKCIEELKNVYAYNDYFKKNLPYSKPNRYISSLGVGEVTLDTPGAKSRKRRKSEEKLKDNSAKSDVNDTSEGPAKEDIKTKGKSPAIDKHILSGQGQIDYLSIFGGKQDETVGIFEAKINDGNSQRHDGVLVGKQEKNEIKEEPIKKTSDNIPVTEKQEKHQIKIEKDNTEKKQSITVQEYTGSEFQESQSTLTQITGTSNANVNTESLPLRNVESNEISDYPDEYLNSLVNSYCSNEEYQNNEEEYLIQFDEHRVESDIVKSPAGNESAENFTSDEESSTGDTGENNVTINNDNKSFQPKAIETPVVDVAVEEPKTTTVTTNGLSLGSDFRLSSGYNDDFDEELPQNETEQITESEKVTSQLKTENKDTNNSEKLDEKENKRYSVYELSSIAINRPEFGQLNTAYGLNERELIQLTAKCESDLVGTEPLVVEYAYNDDIDMGGILVYTGRNDIFWFIIEPTYHFGNIMWRIFCNERPKLCMNYPAIQSYLSAHKLKSNNLISLPAMYAAVNPDVERVIVNDILGNAVHHAPHHLKEFMLNYKGCYYNLLNKLNSDPKALDRYKRNKILEDVMTSSYNIENIVDFNKPGITTFNYQKLDYAYSSKEQLLANSSYGVLTISVDDRAFSGIKGNAITDNVIDRLAKGHLLTRFDMHLLFADNNSVTIACPSTALFSINDILVDLMKKSCRMLDKNVIPKITITNDVK